MGRTLSRQIKDLVPSSRITKELSQLAVASCQLSDCYFYCDKFEGTYKTLSRSLFHSWNERVGWKLQDLGA